MALARKYNQDKMICRKYVFHTKNFCFILTITQIVGSGWNIASIMLQSILVMTFTIIAYIYRYAICIGNLVSIINDNDFVYLLQLFDVLFLGCLHC